MTDKKWTSHHNEKHDIYWIENEIGQTVFDLYYVIDPKNCISFRDVKEHAPIIAAAPEMRDLLRAFIAATEGVFECGHIRTQAMDLMKRIETDEGTR